MSNSVKRETQVQDDGDLKKYRVETPNLLYELRLTPFEMALYCHFKRVAGAGEDGRCYRSAERLAEETGMSEGMISKAKKGLLRTDRPGLNGKPLIHVEKDENRPGRPRDIITIVDIWPENFLFFAQQRSPQRSHSDLQRSPQRSPGDPKNKSESSKKESIEEGTEETLNVGERPRENPKPEQLPNADATFNASPESLSTLFSPDPLPPDPLPPPAPRRGGYGLSSRPPSPATLSLKAQEVKHIIAITSDENSRLRFEQVYDLAEAAGLLTLWEKARQQTCKAIAAAQKTGESIKPGAYFNGLVATLLNKEHPGLIPVGTQNVRDEVHTAYLASRAEADSNAAARQALTAQKTAERGNSP